MFRGIARSGLYATRTSLASPAVCGNDRSPRDWAGQPQSFSVVPTADVDSSTTRLPGRSSGARLLRGSPHEAHVRGVIRSVGRRHRDEKDIGRPVSARIRSASVPTNRTVPGRERFRPLNSLPGHMPLQVACPTARLYKWYRMPDPQSRVRRTRYPFRSRRQLHDDGPGAGPRFPTTHGARHRKRPRASPCLHPAPHYELFRLPNTPPTTEDICSLWLRPARSPTSLVRINTVSDWIDP